MSIEQKPIMTCDMPNCGKVMEKEPDLVRNIDNRLFKINIQHSEIKQINFKNSHICEECMAELHDAFGPQRQEVKKGKS